MMNLVVAGFLVVNHDVVVELVPPQDFVRQVGGPHLRRIAIAFTPKKRDFGNVP